MVFSLCNFKNDGKYDLLSLTFQLNCHVKELNELKFSSLKWRVEKKSCDGPKAVCVACFYFTGKYEIVASCSDLELHEIQTSCRTEVPGQFISCCSLSILNCT